jgi:hypothetical protein
MRKWRNGGSSHHRQFARLSDGLMQTLPSEPPSGERQVTP